MVLGRRGAKNTYHLMATQPAAQVLSLAHGEMLSCHAMQIAFGGLPFYAGEVFKFLKKSGMPKATVDR